MFYGLIACRWGAAEELPPNKECIMPNKVKIGLVMAMAALIITYNNQPVIGLPLFIIGIFLMIYKQR